MQLSFLKVKKKDGILRNSGSWQPQDKAARTIDISRPILKIDERRASLVTGQVRHSLSHHHIKTMKEALIPSELVNHGFWTVGGEPSFEAREA